METELLTHYASFIHTQIQLFFQTVMPYRGTLRQRLLHYRKESPSLKTVVTQSKGCGGGIGSVMFPHPPDSRMIRKVFKTDDAQEMKAHV